MGINPHLDEFSVQADVSLASLRSKASSREEQPAIKRILSCQGVIELERLGTGHTLRWDQ
jgi:hypothetical protein